MRGVPLICALVAAPSLLAAQSAQNASALSFGVDYRGGQSTVQPVKYGHLVLSDSMITFIERGAKPDHPLFVIPISKITLLDGAMDRKGQTVADKVMIGALATSRVDETVTITYDGASDAEAPVFAIEPNRRAEFLGKVHYRLRKMGIEGAARP